MNALGAGILAILIILVLFASRRWAILGIMAGVLYLTQGQVINAFGTHLYAIRILELGGFCRVLVRRELSFSKLNEIDKLFLLTYGYRTFAFIANSNGNPIEAISLIVDASFCYFTFRGLIRTLDELKIFLRDFVILLGPYVVLVSVEMLTTHNPFAVMGWPGVIENYYSRAGRLRCIGSFRHPSLLGTLGASFLPLYISLLFTKKNRIYGYGGICFCLGIVFLSNSGGPLIGATIGVVAWLFWIVRTKMYIVRRMIIGILVLVVIFMKAPIWYLPAKLSVFSGGDGWHRSYLMEVTFRHFDDWWIGGMPISGTKDWFPYHVMTGGADFTNYFLDFGINAGIAAIVIFIFFLIKLFQNLGRALTLIRTNTPLNKETEFLLWGLGVVLTVHVFNWFAIIYFDQSYMILFMHLSVIATFSLEPLISIEGMVVSNMSRTMKVNRFSKSKYKKVTQSIPVPCEIKRPGMKAREVCLISEGRTSEKGKERQAL